jgi:hypothetical protein
MLFARNISEPLLLAGFGDDHLWSPVWPYLPQCPPPPCAQTLRVTEPFQVTIKTRGYHLEPQMVKLRDVSPAIRVIQQIRTWTPLAADNSLSGYGRELRRTVGTTSHWSLPDSVG